MRPCTSSMVCCSICCNPRSYWESARRLGWSIWSGSPVPTSGMRFWLMPLRTCTIMCARTRKIALLSLKVSISTISGKGAKVKNCSSLSKSTSSSSTPQTGSSPPLKQKANSSNSRRIYGIGLSPKMMKTKDKRSSKSSRATKSTCLHFTPSIKGSKPGGKSTVTVGIQLEWRIFVWTALEKTTPTIDKRCSFNDRFFYISFVFISTVNKQLKIKIQYIESKSSINHFNVYFYDSILLDELLDPAIYVLLRVFVVTSDLSHI